ncbi:MAG: hypothetical protein IJL69_07460 [Oscillospiraceae bacterium]|nr:hypothetical protein [Oscillospiraceae bacterium]
MNGIDLLISKLGEEASSDAAARVSEAEEKALVIRAEYAAKAEADAKKLLDETAAQCVADAQRADGSNALEARKAMLAVKHSMIDRVFEKARLKLCRMNEEDYRMFLVRTAVGAVSEGNETVIFNARDREAFGKTLVADINAALKAEGRVGQLKLARETREMDGGFVLCAGNVETNCSISAIVDQKRNELTDLVARMLF